MSATTLDLGDWVDILDLRTDFDDLVAGRASPHQLRSTISARRDTYPGVLGDYVKVLDTLLGQVNSVESAIQRQNEQLENFAEALADAGMSFQWDRDRLLTDAERARLTHIEQLLLEQAAAAEDARAETAEGVAELEAMIGVLADQLATMEGQTGILQEQIAELEQALAEASFDG